MDVDLIGSANCKGRVGDDATDRTLEIVPQSGAEQAMLILRTLQSG